MKVAIIGGGAAGFFAAINVKENYPEATVDIYERSNKVLSKVKVSGGGRCNLTNGTTSIKELCDAYPRGAKYLKKAFKQFSTKDTRDWFAKKGVASYIQDDNRVFPVSNKSQSVIDCFLKSCNELNININKKNNVLNIFTTGEKIVLNIDNKTLSFDKVIITTGGNPKLSGFDFLKNLNIKIENPLPSLFTFNMPNESIRNLMGLVAEKVSVSIQGEKLNASGDLLITHWGMSGPAILKLSAFGAKILAEKEYHFTIHINWIGISNHEEVRESLKRQIENHPNKFIFKHKVFPIANRLWHYLLEKCDINETKKYSELGKKGLNKLINILVNDNFVVEGKTTFKEEFVTCGGVNLQNIDINTMQSKDIPNLYFAGEVLNIDGITGGYNFQAAWTTAFIAAKLS